MFATRQAEYDAAVRSSQRGAQRAALGLLCGGRHRRDMRAAWRTWRTFLSQHAAATAAAVAEERLDAAVATLGAARRMDATRALVLRWRSRQLTAAWHTWVMAVRRQRDNEWYATDLALRWGRVDVVAAQRRRGALRRAWVQWLRVVRGRAAGELQQENQARLMAYKVWLHWRLRFRHAAFLRAYRGLALRVVLAAHKRRLLREAWHNLTGPMRPAAAVDTDEGDDSEEEEEDGLSMDVRTVSLLLLRSLDHRMRRHDVARAFQRWRHAARTVAAAPEPEPELEPLPDADADATSERGQGRLTLAAPQSQSQSQSRPQPAFVETAFGVFEERKAGVRGVRCRRFVTGSLAFVAGVLLLAYMMLWVLEARNEDAFWWEARTCCKWWKW